MDIVSSINTPVCRFAAADVFHRLKPRNLKELAFLVAAVALTGIIAATAPFGVGLICGIGFFSVYGIYKYCQKQSSGAQHPVRPAAIVQADRGVCPGLLDDKAKLREVERLRYSPTLSPILEIEEEGEGDLAPPPLKEGVSLSLEGATPFVGEAPPPSEPTLCIGEGQAEIAPARVGEAPSPSKEGEPSLVDALSASPLLAIEKEGKLVVDGQAQRIVNEVVIGLVDRAVTTALGSMNLKNRIVIKGGETTASTPETVSDQALAMRTSSQVEIFPALPHLRKAKECEAKIGLERENRLPAKIPNIGNTCFAASIIQTALFYQESELNEKIRALGEQYAAEGGDSYPRRTIVSRSETSTLSTLYTSLELRNILKQLKRSEHLNILRFLDILFKIHPPLNEAQRVYRNQTALEAIYSELLVRHLSDASGNTPDYSKEAGSINPKTCRWTAVTELAEKFQLRLPPIPMQQQDADEILTLLLSFIGENNPSVPLIQEQSYGFFNGQFNPFRLNSYAGKRDVALDFDRPKTPFVELIQRSFIEPGPKGYKIDGKEVAIEHLRTYLSRPPKMLILPFKRYTAYGEKIVNPVPGIDEILTLPSDYFLNKETATYRLDALILHIGGPRASQGHYVAVRRCIDAQGNIRFFLADDDKIQYLSAFTKEKLAHLVGISKGILEGETELELFLSLAQFSYIPIYNRIS